MQSSRTVGKDGADGGGCGQGCDDSIPISDGPALSDTPSSTSHRDIYLDFWQC